jgi:hypothetical protein
MLDGFSYELTAGQDMMVTNIGEREAKIIQLLGAGAMEMYKMV